MPKKLSKLKKVELRDAWRHEAYDFTEWLSQKENLDLLSQEIGVDIKVLETEAGVGNFSVDILAENENTGKKIIIENQLEDTNHDHLGKIITYASGYDAEMVVWIVKNAREEHQKAIEWLNEHTDDDIHFFLIKIELWQIENSNPAPRFDIISGPNEWANILKSTKGGELTETKIKQLEFWKEFQLFLREKDKNMKLRKPAPCHWYNISIGSSDAHISLTLNTRDNALGCELYINKNKDLFNFLKGRKSKIEKEIGGEIKWVDAPVASCIRLLKPVSSVLDKEKQMDYFEWFFEKNRLFQKVFDKYLREFKHKDNK